jgi:hypothetical protein
MSTNQEPSTGTSEATTAATTGETPAGTQPKKRNRVSVEMPPPVAPLAGQIAIPGSGVPEVIKRRPGRPRGRTTPDEHGESAPVAQLPRLSPLDWLNLRYAAGNFRAACEGENEPEAIRLLRLLSGVWVHVIRPGDSENA